MKADVKEIIRVRDDGTQDKVEHGAVFELDNKDLSISFVGLEPLDIVELAAGLIGTVREMGLKDLLDQMTSLIYMKSVSRGKPDE